MDGEIDLLALLDTSPSEGQPSDVVDRCSGELERPSSFSAGSNEDLSDSDQRPCHRDSDAGLNVRLPNMIGKIGRGRHVEKSSQKMLTLHMRHCKSLIQHAHFRSQVAELLDESSFRKDGKLIGVRAEMTTCGVIIKFSEKNRTGNRFKKSIPWGDFLSACYGRFKRDTHISLALDVSRSTARFMSLMVSSVYLAQQSVLLGKLIGLASSSAPCFFIRHLKWDETSLWTSVNADLDERRRVASSWEVMVVRQRIILGWMDGSVAIIRLVMPPAVLLSGSAQNIYYALRHHPLHRAVQDLVDRLGDLCWHRGLVLESDAAYANDRLVGYLLQRNKTDPRKSHLVHGKYQNHQSQLVNVSLLSIAGHNLLSRMYGLAVFIRNLGNWLRLKQALRSWVEDTLIFDQCVMDVGSGAEPQNSHHPAILELVSYLRHNRKVESQTGEGSAAFERAVHDFLDMFNSNTELMTPCHRCSHHSVPHHQRHCFDRSEAVRKCVEALTNMFLNAMPSVPAPNKWTTLYPCLDPWHFYGPNS